MFNTKIVLSFFEEELSWLKNNTYNVHIVDKFLWFTLIAFYYKNNVIEKFWISPYANKQIINLKEDLFL